MVSLWIVRYDDVDDWFVYLIVCYGYLLCFRSGLILLICLVVCCLTFVYFACWCDGFSLWFARWFCGLWLLGCYFCLYGCYVVCFGWFVYSALLRIWFLLFWFCLCWVCLNFVCVYCFWCLWLILGWLLFWFVYMIDVFVFVIVDWRILVILLCFVICYLAYCLNFG